MDNWCGSRNYAVVSESFTHHKVCWGVYQAVREAFANDPRLSDANPIFERVETPGVGRHLAAGAAVRIAGVPRGASEPAPLLGQDTDRILMEVLRLDAAAVAKLHDAGVIAGPEKDRLMSGC